MSTLKTIFYYVNEKQNTSLANIQEALGFTDIDIALALAILEKEGLIDVIVNNVGVLINGKGALLPTHFKSIALKPVDFDDFKDEHFSSKAKILH